MFKVQFGVDHELRKVGFKRMDLRWGRMISPCRTQALNYVSNL